ncbi:MAG: hypothetical protein JSS89_04765 [Bacteroidetes bacterium]|nr:hypothetical protein [Bacteroidota bacterium]
MSTSQRPNTDDLFDALRTARHATPLLTEADVADAMHHVPSVSITPYRSPAWIVAACALTAAVAITAWYLQRGSDNASLPPSPETVTKSTVMSPQQPAAPARVEVATHTRSVNATSNADRHAVVRAPRTQAPTPTGSARIAGLPFLDLSASEFAALPEGLQPEIRTQRVRTSNASGRVREQRTLECLTHTAQASSVVDNGEEYVQMSALYIPVRRVEQTANGKVETVEWFKPTGDLISLLPERYRVPIMLELNLLTEVQRGCITPSEACRSLPHAQSYFDMCRLDASRIKDITIAPNPARGMARCTIDLRYSATIHLAAYTTSGAYVADLTEAVTLDPGVHEVSVPLNGVAPGMYLITTTTQDGEHVVRRLIVE